MASGHVPGSRNIPSSAFYHADNSMKRGEELRRLFLDAGTDFDRPIITSCGSGVTAAILLAGLELLGKTDVTLYDGSRSEEHTSELQSLMRTSYAVFCLKKKKSN